MIGPSRFVLLTTSALALAGCTSNSAVKTTESWTEVTPQQAVAELPRRIDVYAEHEKAPPMKNGCATDIEQSDDVLVVRNVSPRGVYCIAVAPLRMTTVELPAGTVMTGVQSSMVQYLEIHDAPAGGRHTITLQSRCLPLRKDDAGQIVPSDLRTFFPTQREMEFCPRTSGDLVVFTSSGPVYFRVVFNEDTRVRVVDLRDDPTVEPKRSPVPIKAGDAQELYATALNGDVPWTPDDAWATGNETVIVWHRPMPTLPSMHVGEGGEQLATPPTIIHEGRVIAMVYPRRLTLFQLRIDDRALQFSPDPPEPPRNTLWSGAEPAEPVAVAAAAPTSPGAAPRAAPVAAAVEPAREPVQLAVLDQPDQRHTDRRYSGTAAPEAATPRRPWRWERHLN